MPYARFGGRTVSYLGKRRLAGAPARRLVRSRLASSSARRFALGPYLGTAVAVGAMGARYAYGRRMRAISRAKRNYIRRKAKIGKSPWAKRPCKCTQVGLSTITTKLTNTIHVVELDTLSKETSLPSEQQRYSDYVHLKGWRVHKFFENLDTRPMMFNMAIITTKVHDSAAVLDDTATGKTNIGEDFFRDETNPNRVLTLSTGLSGFQWNQYGINTDRWIVLKRYQRLLSGTAETDVRKREWNFNKYVKFNRQLHYDNSEDKPEANRTFLVHWAALPQATSNTLPAPAAASYNHCSNIKIFFRDINPK